MKKNITINLYGTLYNIDEDAYNLLESYLQSMQRYYSRQDGGEEVADDIEHRVAELLWQRREEGMTAININTIKEIIDTIGKTEDIVDDNVRNESRENGFKENPNQAMNDANRFARDAYDKGNKHIQTHRFYRCADDKILGGVCSGLAVYFNAGDPVVWRLLAILLFFLGIGMVLPIVYLIMWIATPAALTVEDRLRQQGKEITPENLAQQVKEESQPAVAKENHNGCLKTIVIVLAVLFIIPFLIFLFTICGIFWNVLF